MRRRTRSHPTTMLLLLLGAVSAATAADPPRYELTPGRHLVYEGREVAETRSGSLGLDRRTEVYVARALADGGWRLVVTRFSQRFTNTGGTVQQHPGRQELFVLDLLPDGRMPDRATDMLGTLHRLFPRLPDGDEAAWTFRAADVVNRCRPLPSGTAGTWEMELIPESDLWRLQEFSATFTLSFDRAAGIVRAVNGQNRHRDRDTRVETERLVSDTMLSADEARALAAEIDRVAAAEEHYLDARTAALGTEDAAAATAGLDRALADLERATDGLASPLLRDHLGALVQGHRASAGAFAQQIATNAQLLGRPAPAWSYVDLDGAPHALADERGRVVVLDFWYRHCGWCIRSVPQLRLLRERVADRPVTVLGMNVDRKLEDAQLVARELDLPWRNLRADRTVTAALGVRAYPTVVVLDGAGIVRHVHRGYTPDLADELERAVERILGPSAATTAPPAVP